MTDAGSSVEDNQFIMRADDVSIIDPDDTRGRSSVRIALQKAYDDSVIVLDLEHMPAGCATWPAFWTLSSTGPWPDGGEIDIIEGTPLVSFSSPSRVTHASISDRRCQRERGKPGHFAYYRKLHDAPRLLAPAAVWVGLVFSYTRLGPKFHL